MKSSRFLIPYLTAMSFLGGPLALVTSTTVGCAALTSLAPLVGPAISAVESVISAAQKAGIAPTDPQYIQALAQAKVIDAARAARDASTKARDNASAKHIAAIEAAEIAEKSQLVALLAEVRAHGACPAAPALAPMGTSDAGK